MGINDEKNTYDHNESQEKENARFSRQDGDQRGPAGTQQEKGQGEKETDSIIPVHFFNRQALTG